jgi:hypothetical protein
MAHFFKADELDAQFAAAFGMAARCYSQAKTTTASRLLSPTGNIT